jgi:hypothetical protein
MLSVYPEVAEKRTQSLDQYFKDLLEKDEDSEIEDIRNETITGDIATVEVKIGGKWGTWAFIIENGEWKKRS